MLKLEVAFSLLHSLVADCRERGKDPTEELSSEVLLEQIAHIAKVGGDVAETEQLQSVSAN